MKKLIINESQLKKILNEGPYDIIKSYVNKSKDLKQGQGTLSGSELSTISDDLYDAIKGAGTDNEAIRAAFSKCVNFHDVVNIFNKFRSRKGENLLDWLDGDIDYDSEWDKDVLRPISTAYDASKSAGHFEEEEVVEQDETEKVILEKFPCIKDEEGYSFKRSKNNILYFQTTANEGIKDYGIKMDGTMYYYKDRKWNMAPEKAKCDQAEYQDIAEELNYGFGGVKTEPVGTGTVLRPSDETTGNTTTTGSTETKTDTETKKVETPEKPKVVTKLMTGSDVEEIQTILHKQGFGDIVGSVDGKLGPKTLAGIKKLFLGATRPKIEAITMLEPKGIKPIETKIEPAKLVAEDIQKNFKRFL